jgi:hypothetical protein
MSRLFALSIVVAVMLLPVSPGLAAMLAGKAEVWAGNFPQSTKHIISPNKKYAVYNINLPTEDAAGNYHQLRLQDLGNGNRSEQIIYAYGRSVEVMWSPQGNKLVINDHGGSDYSNCVVFDVNTHKYIDIEKELQQQQRYNQSLWKNHHVYISCIAWLSESTLSVKVHGYGDVDPNGFAARYEYTIL